MKKNKQKLILIILAGLMTAGSIGYILFLINPLAGLSFNKSVEQKTLQNSYAYENEQHNFGFEFPQSYMLDDRQFNTQGFMYLTKNVEWDKESGAPLKGSVIYISTKKIAGTLEEHVKTVNTNFQGLIDDQISEISINNQRAIVFDAENGVPIKYPGVKSIYLQNKEEVLDFTLMMGAYTTIEEFNEYVKEFEDITSTIYLF